MGPTPTGVMTSLSTIFPTDDSSSEANPFEQHFKKAQQKDDSSSSTDTTKEKVPVNGLPGPEVIESAEVVEEEQDIDEQQAEQPTAMSTGDTVMEEIQTSFDHEETIENVGNEETIGDEDMNDKKQFPGA